jgi:AraC-like DNA-binding protein
MRYREFRPTSALAEHLDCFWSIEAGLSAAGPRPVQRILPDGCIEMIFHLKDPVQRLEAKGIPIRQPSSFISGQIKRFILIQPVGQYAAFGVRLRPGMAFPIIGIPMRELTERSVDLGLVWGKKGQRLTKEVQSAKNNRERIRCIENFLSDVLRQGSEPNGATLAAVRWILQSEGRVPIDFIVSKLGMSSRQLERGFNDHVGLTPKLFSRIVRLQKVFSSSANRPAPMKLTNVAYECGYYDQAHFIKDFKSLAGQKPSEYFRHSNPMSAAFTSNNRMSNFYNSISS